MSSTVKYISDHWLLYYTLGLLLCLVGILAFIFSTVTTLASVIYLGILLTSTGFIELIRAFRLRANGGFSHLIISLLYLSLGIFMIIKPEINALSLTLIIGIALTIVGSARIGFALSHAIPYSGLMILQGFTTALLGVLIWYQWPFSGLWVLGTFTALDILFNGIAWMKLAIRARSLQSPTEMSETQRIDF